MRIKSSKNKYLRTDFKNFIKSIFLRKFKLFFFSPILFFSFLGVFFLIEKNDQLIPKNIKNQIKNSIFFQFIIAENKINLPFNFIKGQLNSTDKLYLNINFKNLEKLNIKRNQALKRGVLITEDDDYVKAKLNFNNFSIPINLRLKGDWTDHFSGDKWSFRVKVKGDNSFLGMKKFSLHRPETRSYIDEWLFHEFLREESLPALKYSFINLFLNGKDYGIYAVEEHFDKHLLEANKFKEGPIIKLSESLVWERQLRSLKNNNKPIIWDRSFKTYEKKLDQFNSYGEEPIYQSKVTPFKENYITNNKVFKDQFDMSVQLLEKFLSNELKTSDVFDLDHLSTFYAISDLMGATHGTFWENQRFYYNPFISKLSPIGFDAEPGVTIPKLTIEYAQLGFFNDLKFVEAYISKLEKLTSDNYFQNFLKNNQKSLENNLAILYKSYPLVSSKKEVYKKNELFIKDKLRPKNPLHIFNQKKTSDDIKLSIANNQIFPIEIISFHDDQGEVYYPDKKEIIMGKQFNKFPKYNEFTLRAKENSIKTIKKDNETLFLRYRLLGGSEVLKNNINNYSRIESIDVKNDLLIRETNFEEFPFIKEIKGKNEIIFLPGNWILRKPLILPKDYIISASGGFNLSIENKGLIISKSAIKFNGSSSNPINITAEEGGQGLIVIQADKRSTLKFVNFKKLSSPNNNLWSVTGAVTFYESPVLIDNCKFEENFSEDALNLFRSDFLISNSEFLNTYSDAIDLDFSNGKLLNLKLNNSGNDAIDVSGSDIEANDIFINNAKDKGLSVGEDSYLKGNNFLIKETDIAIASKDLSVVEINNISLEMNKVGLVAFQKKPEYGPGNILIQNIFNKKFEVEYLLEPRSKIVLNNKNKKINTENVESLLYGIRFGKKSGL